jgi:hypothetical protein
MNRSSGSGDIFCSDYDFGAALHYSILQCNGMNYTLLICNFVSSPLPLHPATLRELLMICLALIKIINYYVIQYHCIESTGDPAEPYRVTNKNMRKTLTPTPEITIGFWLSSFHFLLAKIREEIKLFLWRFVCGALVESQMMLSCPTDLTRLFSPRKSRII